MLKVQFSARPEAWDDYRVPLEAACLKAGLEADIQRKHDPADVDYIVFAPNGPVRDFSPFVKAKAVLSLWAGVESIVGNETLTQPLARMVDGGLTEGMVEWVTGHTLRHHLGIDRYIGPQDGRWTPVVPPLARDRTVGILGLGALGQACAQALVALNFNTLGWSRRPKDVDGVICHSGDGGLRKVLSEAEILVLLLPQTDGTENTLNAERLGWMPRGSVVINPGRGPLIDDDALLSTLDSGQIAHATLDVFRVEPLPPEHPYWSHPSVTVTPHIAAETRASTASQVIAENIRRSEAGEPLLYLVDRAAGY